MSEPNYTQQYNLDVDPQVAAQEATLNEQLGFYVPEEESASAGVWESLFGTLRMLYSKSYFTQEQTAEAVTYFYEQSSQEREALIQRLLDFSRQHDVETELVEVMATQYDLREELNEIMELLPPEIRDEFKHYVTTGEELPTRLTRQAQATVAGDSDATERLNRLLTTKMPATATRTLSPADLRAKFNVTPENVITEEIAPDTQK